MENNNSTHAATKPPSFVSSSNYSHQNHNSTQPYKHNRAGILVSNASFMILITIISLIVLVTICLIVITIRKLKFFKDKGSSKGSNSNSIENASNGFIAHNTVSYNSSPDIKGGCLYGGSLVRADLNRSRGVQVFTLKELEMATNRFSESNVIGKGGFGTVYRGVLGDGTVAAVKILHREGKQGERAFRIEVDLLSRLHCPYLVELLGYCADKDHRLLIFEFMPNGSLQQHLHPCRAPSHTLDWGTRLRIALDCARALQFLHEHSEPSIIHRDFKCSNILLDHNFHAKVSDFGLARMGSDKINGQVSTRVLGTTGYLAPEYISTGKLTTKSDVYSYGVVLLELLTGRVPVDTKRPPGEQNLITWALPRLTSREKLEEMVDPALKGNYPKKELIQVAAIAAVCVQAEADYRPLMMDVVQSLIPLAKNYSTISFSSSTRGQNNGSPKQ